MLVFYHIVTFSIAIVGISAIIILLKALASGGSAPMKSNTISSSVNFLIYISVFWTKYFNVEASNLPVVPLKLAGCSNVLKLSTP
jgi:hypothetical protein